jgi:hypothetical protein
MSHVGHPARHRAGPKRRGSSLLEIMIAIAVSVTALGASIRSQLQAERLAGHARETLIAVSILNGALARAEQVGAAEVWNGSADFVHGQSVANVDYGALQDGDLRLNLPQKGGQLAAPAVVEIELTLTWTDQHNAERSLSAWGGVR